MGLILSLVVLVMIKFSRVFLKIKLKKTIIYEKYKKIEYEKDKTNSDKRPFMLGRPPF